MDDACRKGMEEHTEIVFAALADRSAERCANSFARYFEGIDHESKVLGTIGEWIGVPLLPLSKAPDEWRAAIHKTAWLRPTRSCVIALFRGVYDDALDARHESHPATTIPGSSILDLGKRLSDGQELPRRLGLPRDYARSVMNTTAVVLAEMASSPPASFLGSPLLIRRQSDEALLVSFGRKEQLELHWVSMKS
jgi:hypothetical protein